MYSGISGLIKALKLYNTNIAILLIVQNPTTNPHIFLIHTEQP